VRSISLPAGSRLFEAFSPLCPVFTPCRLPGLFACMVLKNGHGEGSTGLTMPSSLLVGRRSYSPSCLPPSFHGRFVYPIDASSASLPYASGFPPLPFFLVPLSPVLK